MAQVDRFVLEGVSVEELRRLVLSHDGEGHGAGVYVDQVTVRELRDPGSSEGQEDMEVVFPCHQWLDDHEGDRCTERELRPAGPSSVQKGI